MGLFDRVEQRLERAVNGAFARAFKSEVQPVEIASAIRRAMDDRAAVLGHGRTIVPNLFTVELSDTDYDRLGGYDEELENELVAAAQEHAESQRYQPGGPLQVNFASATTTSRPASSALRTSTARRPGAAPATPRAERGTPRRRRVPEPRARRPAPDPHRLRRADGTRRRRTRGDPARTLPRRPARRVNPADRPWLDVDGERYPLHGRHHGARPRRQRRHHPRRPGHLPAAQRDPGDQRRPAPRRQHPRPRLDQRHVRQQRADHAASASRTATGSPWAAPPSTFRAGRR